MAQQGEGLVDGGVAVAIAVQDVAEDRQGTQVIDDGTDSDLDQLDILSTVAIGEVSWWEVGAGSRGRQREVVRAWLGRVVGAAEVQVSRVEVEAFAGQVSKPERLLGDVGQDGVALAEEGVESPAEAVVVELVDGDVPEEVGPSLRRPFRDVDESRRPREAGRQQ